MAGKYGFAYGIAKWLGIDTTGMTVGEVFEAIKDAEGTKGGKAKKPYERPDEKETERESDETKKPKGETSDGFGGEHEATDAEKKRLREMGIGIRKSGAKSGALDSEYEDYERANRHADIMYETYRNINSDVSKIAKTTGFSEDDIKEIKDYVFDNPEFFPDYDIAQTWDRLRKGKPINVDITFLQHEQMEIAYRKNGYSYEKAHRLANEKHDYGTEIKELKNGLVRKNRDNK